MYIFYNMIENKSEFFILTEETKINSVGIEMHRIKCVKTFRYAKEGDLGGWISGDAEVYGNAEVYGDENITYKVINIVTHAWPITFGNKIMIGCQRHSVDEWRGFDVATIASMHEDAVNFWAEWKEIVFATWELHKKINLPTTV